MLDFKIFEIRTDIFILIVSLSFFLAQLLLCFKKLRLRIRLIPVFFWAGITGAFVILMPFFDGWDAVGFLLLAVWSAIVLLFCGLAWAVWAIVKKINNKKA